MLSSTEISRIKSIATVQTHYTLATVAVLNGIHLQCMFKSI